MRKHADLKRELLKKIQLDQREIARVYLAYISNDPYAMSRLSGLMTL